MIELALGDAETAAGYLRLALATNPHFHPRHAEDARRTLETLNPRAGGRRWEAGHEG
jgi:hypothetical protein